MLADADIEAFLIKAGHVSLLQRIVIGDMTYMIQDLLAIAQRFICADDHTTIEFPHWKATASGK